MCSDMDTGVVHIHVTHTCFHCFLECVYANMHISTAPCGSHDLNNSKHFHEHAWAIRHEYMNKCTWTVYAEKGCWYVRRGTHVLGSEKGGTDIGRRLHVGFLRCVPCRT